MLVDALPPQPACQAAAVANVGAIRGMFKRALNLTRRAPRRDE